MESINKGYVVAPTYLKSVQSCHEEHHNYCINGLCIFHVELKTPTCRCLAGYSGERCEHLMLNSYTQFSSEHYIAVGTAAGMLLIAIAAVIYCYIRQRCRKTKSSYKVCYEKTAV
ncbi:epigen [Hemicordylus capensis]|uniref:epigen n=1 Tax=Hemicordylus capensis TaxID=884348 RepID=UPI00230308D5|nr:epigen [Hemicordylus capensis]